MARGDKSRSLQWGSANRPKISNKLGIPHPSEGSNGDIQLRQTSLGSKLYGKIGGIWRSTFLSSEEEIIGTSGTKIGMDSSGALSVEQINLTGKITLTSTGTQNVCIGTGNSDIGSNNVLLGVSSGNSIVPGDDSNVCIGSEAGLHVNGNDNIAIGTEALQMYDGSNTSSSDNVAIGRSAMSLAMTSDDGAEIPIHNVGIGTLALKLVDGDFNVAIGRHAGLNISTGDANVCIGNEAGDSITTGNTNACIGNAADVSSSGATNQIVIGYNAAGNGNNKCVIGNASILAILPADDNGVNLGSTSYSFNDIFYDGATLTSDKRLKENITSLSLGLEFINKLNPVSFKKKDKEEVYDGDRLIQRAITYKRKHTGLISQEVKEVMDDMGIDSNDFAGYVDANLSGGVDKLFLRYDEFIAPIIKAVQELSAKLDTMQEEINNLK